MTGDHQSELLEELASDQAEQERLLSEILTEVRAGRSKVVRQLRYLAVAATIGVLATLLLVIILLAGFSITVSTH